MKVGNPAVLYINLLSIYNSFEIKRKYNIRRVSGNFDEQFELIN